MVTTSPGRRVNDSSGTMPVPVSSTAPTGKVSAAISHPARCSNRRVMLAVLVDPSNATESRRKMRRLMSNGRAAASQAARIPGPRARSLLRNIAINMPSHCPLAATGPSGHKDGAADTARSQLGVGLVHLSERPAATDELVQGQPAAQVEREDER